MKSFNTVVVVVKNKTQEMPFGTVRNRIKWKSTRSNVSVAKMDTEHINNCVDLLKTYNACHEYQDITVRAWLDLFRLELKYRSLQAGINSYKSCIRNNRIKMEKLLES